MNITEANAVQEALAYLLDHDRTHTAQETGRDALALLADRSWAVLGAGRTGNRVIQEFARLEETCLGCAECNTEPLLPLPGDAGHDPGQEPPRESP